MKTIDKDGLLLCELQAKTFELSVDKAEVSSAVFIRRFMNSNAARLLDGESVLALNTQPVDLLDMLEEQYGFSKYGSEKYSQDEMYWMGYIYRYYAYTYEQTSVNVYKIVKPKELRGLFLPYHALDPSQAIERILEAKGISKDNDQDIIYQYAIFRRIRKETKSATRV